MTGLRKECFDGVGGLHRLRRHALDFFPKGPGPAAWLGLALILLAVPSAGEGRKRPATPSTGLKTIAFGHPAPDFSFDTGGGTRRLHDLTGKPVVINFWATWCPPCLDELPAFLKFRETFGDRVELVTISGEAPGLARDYVASNHLGLPVAEDPQKHIFSTYSVEPIPVTLILRPGGMVSHVSVGEIDWPELRDAVDAALAP